MKNLIFILVFWVVCLALTASVDGIYVGKDSIDSSAVDTLKQQGNITGQIRGNYLWGITGATVTCGDISVTTGSYGYYTLTVDTGIHSITASYPGYLPYTYTGVEVTDGQTLTLNFTLQPEIHNSFSDSFEDYPDFSLSFAPWTLVDYDLSPTFGISGTSWPNAGAPMAYMVFNPSATIPPLTGYEPQDGNKYVAAFASDAPPNYDWLISPMVAAGFVSFWARSFSDEHPLERFKVGVSLGYTMPGGFQIISGQNYIEAPLNWTQYSFDLSPYYYQNIRIAILCCSNESFMFGIDNFMAAGITQGEDDTYTPVQSSTLEGNYPNPFNPETTIRYSLKESGPVSIKIYNSRGQLVKNLVNSDLPKGQHSVVWDGRDDNGKAVSGGIYLYQLSAGQCTSARKMLLVK